jgi:hypothetical protein
LRKKNLIWLCQGRFSPTKEGRRRGKEESGLVVMEARARKATKKEEEERGAQSRPEEQKAVC